MTFRIFRFIEILQQNWGVRSYTNKAQAIRNRGYTNKVRLRGLNYKGGIRSGFGIKQAEPLKSVISYQLSVIRQQVCLVQAPSGIDGD